MKLTVPFILGIVIHHLFPLQEGISLLCFCLSIPLLYLFLSRFLSSPFTRLDEAAIVLLFLFMGYSAALAHEPNPKPLKEIAGKQFWLGKLHSISPKSTGAQQLQLEITHLQDSFSKSNPLVQVYLKNGIPSLAPGDELAFFSELKLLEPSLLNLPFDYSTYLMDRGVIYQSYAKEAFLVRSFGHVRSRAWKWRLTIEAAYERLELNAWNLGVLKALTLGEKSSLSPDQKTKFAQLGAMHLLAVSGLHVGIVFIFLDKLLFFLGRRPKSQWLKQFLILLGIWSFALVVGFGPSVVRAAGMFTLFAIAKLMNRKASTLNLVFASALLMLCFDSSAVFDLGFQLSYLAVLGIVVVFPKLKNLLQIRSRVLKWFWELICVSVAAQLATLPLTLFYFHQFPTWFLLSNLLLVPLAFLIMASLIPAIVLAYSFPEWGWHKFLNHLLSFFESIVKALANLPYPLVDNIWISEFLMVCFFFTLIVWTYLLHRQGRWSIIFLVFSLGLLPLIHRIESGHSKRSSFLAIYGYKNNFYYLKIDESSALWYPLTSNNKQYLESQLIAWLQSTRPSIEPKKEFPSTGRKDSLGRSLIELSPGHFIYHSIQRSVKNSPDSALGYRKIALSKRPFILYLMREQENKTIRYSSSKEQVLLLLSDSSFN